jgi:hypothetical protein
MTFHLETLVGMKAKVNGNIHKHNSLGGSLSQGSLFVARISRNWHGCIYSMPHFIPIVDSNATIRDKFYVFQNVGLFVVFYVLAKIMTILRDMVL